MDIRALLRQVLSACLATVLGIVTRWLYERLALPAPSWRP